MVVAAAAAAARVPFLSWPMGSDEGGLLMIAAQWHPGTSLYGDYWVDRPPLLVDVFALADRLGGLPALRVIGTVLVVVSVLLSARAARLVGGSPWAGAVTAAVFLVTPLFGVDEVNGELVATPLVLGAIVLVLTAARTDPTLRRSPRRGWLVVAAGGSAAAAALVKQNEIDGLVLVAVGAWTFLRPAGRARWSSTWLAVAGAGAVVAAVLAQAAARGTEPAALWDAVVVFRLDAARAISAHAPATVDARLRGVVLALLASGAPLLVASFVARLRRRPREGALDLRWATVAVLVWESFSVVGGGSYWLHYLICLVPGLVLATSVVTAGPRSGRRWPEAALGLAAVSAIVASIGLLHQPTVGRTDPVIEWLRAHRSPGQTGVVAFGHPDYLAATGLSSPYPELWSLPVRVRDPHLSQLTAVLAADDRPDWVVTGPSGSLGGWGIDATLAQQVFGSHYRLVADLGDRRIYLDLADPLTRRVASPGTYRVAGRPATRTDADTDAGTGVRP